MNLPEKHSPKKPYRSPVIQVYGDIRKVTKTLGASGKNDSMGSSATMTGL